MSVWVLIGVYGDKSGFRIPRVYENQYQAAADRKLLAEMDTTRDWSLVETELLEIDENLA